MSIRPRKPVERLQKYRPPLEGRAGKLRLDFNENTVGCAPAVIRALRRVVTADALSRYPEYEEGRATLADYFGVSQDEMLMTNGVDDAIKLICDTFVEPGDRLVIPAPTFPIYQFFQDVAGGKTVLVRYDEDLRLPVERVVEAINRRTRWVALANPNNPTGTMIPKNDLAVILRAAPRTIVLVDEAYFDFSQATVLSWIRKYPNLLVSRTFSKAFGLAALRIGFLFGNTALVGMMRRVHAVFAVNAVAMAAALEAINNVDYVERYAKMIRAQREVLTKRLDALGIVYAPSAANFVFLRVGARAPEIARRFREQDVLVRDWSYDPHLRGYLRITIGTAAQMRRLIEELERTQHLIETREGARAWQDLVTYSPTGYFA
ncbi:MAG TPA: histidinol-phosphate transaminase [Terriglobia bacterium]|nr:histidinol-phosphate transaminase [Terriglobia bacterium]